MAVAVHCQTANCHKLTDQTATDCHVAEYRGLVLGLCGTTVLNLYKFRCVLVKHCISVLVVVVLALH
jgi:hypothetical protein